VFKPVLVWRQRPGKEGSKYVPRTDANGYHLSTCNGEGTTITAKCSPCKGEGRVYGEETVNIDIPAGVQEGMQLSISGKGNAGERGGNAGDLIVLIEEEPHQHLHRDGLNVAFDLYISFPDAVFGTQVEVPTIDGRAKIKSRLARRVEKSSG
jgi:molecular chaperone DnaJ